MSDRPRTMPPGDPADEDGSGASRRAAQTFPTTHGHDSTIDGESRSSDPGRGGNGLIPLLTEVAQAGALAPASAAGKGDGSGTPPLEARPGTREARGTEAVDATEHLNSAISELEHVLSERHGVQTGLRAGHDRTIRGESSHPGTTQYTIPLLDEVVVPGVASPGMTGPRIPRLETQVDHTAELRALAEGAGAYRPIFERLASEIEVIVQAGVEEALRDAARAIRRRVNEHIEIILPEILDELSRKHRGDED